MSASVKSEVVIKDACIFFDLIDLDQISNFYKLDLIVVTRPEVLAEIVDEGQRILIQSFIDSGQLQIDDFDALEVFIKITNENPGLSLTDAAVLHTAAKLNATLLSSDKSLRNESRRQGLVVKGLLWVLEELYIKQVINIETFIAKLELYITVNARAPKVEIDQLIKKYKT